MTIEVDAKAAEIIRRAQARAQSLGETLGDYRQHTLPPEIVGESEKVSQAEAWNAFVAGMTAWSENLPREYVADNSRDAIYDDRIRWARSLSSCE